MSIIQKAKRYGFTPDKNKICIVTPERITGNTAIGYLGKLRFFVTGVNGLKVGQDVLVVSTGVTEEEVEAETASSHLDDIVDKITKTEQRYYEILDNLPNNEQPYNLLAALCNEAINQKERLYPYPRNTESLPRDIVPKLNRVREKTKSIIEQISETLSFVESIQSLFDAGDDTNIFSLELEAEVSEEAECMGKDEAMDVSELKYEIMAKITEDAIALMEPSGYLDGAPIYEFPNILLGRQKIQLTRIDREGMFYCNVCNPSEEQIRKYIGDFGRRVSRCSEIAEKLALNSEIVSLRRHLEREAGNYPLGLLEQTKKMHKSIDDEYSIWVAQQNAQIITITPNNMDLFCKSDRELFSALGLNQMRDHYVFTCSDTDGRKTLVTFYAETQFPNFDGHAPNFSQPITYIKPILIHNHRHGEVMALLATSLITHPLARFGDVYLCSPKMFNIEPGIGSFDRKIKTPGSQATYVYKLDHPH